MRSISRKKKRRKRKIRPCPALSKKRPRQRRRRKARRPSAACRKKRVSPPRLLRQAGFADPPPGAPGPQGQAGPVGPIGSAGLACPAGPAGFADAAGPEGPAGPTDPAAWPAISVHPVVQRFFFVPPSAISMSEPQVLAAERFENDQGEPATEFPDFGRSGYYNLYVNGVLQEGSLYRVDSRSVALAPTGQTIIAGAPIILESVGFLVRVS